jgi:hypothetical protein
MSTLYQIDIHSDPYFTFWHSHVSCQLPFLNIVRAPLHETPPPISTNISFTREVAYCCIKPRLHGKEGTVITSLWVEKRCGAVVFAELEAKPEVRLQVLHTKPIDNSQLGMVWKRWNKFCTAIFILFFFSFILE